MRRFAEIFELAAERKGGAAALEALLPSPAPKAEIAAVPDDRWLAAFSKKIFATGLSSKMIDDKWPRFEEVFHGFQLNKLALCSDDDLDDFLKADGIVRHAQKIRAVRDNAVFLQAFGTEHGGVGPRIAAWPAEDYAELLLLMKKDGARLGGNTGPYALREFGVDGFVSSKDVVAALVREGVIASAPGSKRAYDAVQAAFDAWAAESGRPMMQISRTLALSVG